LDTLERQPLPQTFAFTGVPMTQKAVKATRYFSTSEDKYLEDRQLAQLQSGWELGGAARWKEAFQE